jgi:hypothetical protein
MISLLRSRFSEVARRAAYLTSERLIVYHWSRGKLAKSFVFATTGNGHAHFERYLQETPKVPTYLLVDIVEEEYRQETAPHVMGSDRKATLDLKRNRLFRGTPYTNALVQGRLAEGRRDDIILLTALINPALIDPWVQLLEKHQAPLAGIYSAPVLGQELLKSLHVKTEHSLLVTLHSSGGIRQSFYSGPHLKLSRLARMPRLGAVPFLGYLLEEVERISRYLASIRVLPGEAPLDVYILAHGRPLEELQRGVKDTDLNRFHILDIDQVANDLNMGQNVDTPYSDAVFSHLLLKTKPASHYTVSRQQRYFQLYQARLGIQGVALGTLLAAMLFSGMNFLKGAGLSQESALAAQKANYYQSRYEAAHAGLPTTPIPLADIKAAIDTVKSINAHSSTPAPMLETVSAALQGFPHLQVKKIDWIASQDPNQHAGEGAPAVTDGTAEQPINDPAYPHFQIATVQGYIDPFNGDFRAALDEVNRFADKLKELPDVKRVKVQKLPLAIDSGASLQGGSEDTQAQKEAEFEITIVLGVKREAV